MCDEVLIGRITGKCDRIRVRRAQSWGSKMARMLHFASMDLLHPAAGSYPCSALRRLCRMMSGIFLALVLSSQRPFFRLRNKRRNSG